uniref:Uncharacterized protein n=1 Tax=Sphaerodactylus townsendi TaxID=933632 RepID=A0ACB8EC63_9SAUR
MQHCVDDLCCAKCEGCILDLGNQMGHDYLDRGAEIYNQNLKHFHENLNIEPALYIIVILGSSLKCFTVHQGHNVSLEKIIHRVARSHRPTESLRKLSQKYHKPYVTLVEKHLQKNV